MKSLALVSLFAVLPLSAALAAPAPTGAPTAQAKVQSPDTFELRGVIEVAAPNTEAIKSREDGQMVNVLISPILTLADVQHATVHKSGSQTLLHLELKADGSEKLHDYTKTHLKDKIAVLVNDQVMATPDILETIDKSFDVKLPNSVDAQRLADAVNTGSKVRPTTANENAAEMATQKH